jgi:hypothetical protein
MRLLAWLFAALLTVTGHEGTETRRDSAFHRASAPPRPAAAAYASAQRATGELRGRVDIRRTAPPSERRPGVTDLGAQPSRPAPEARRAVVYLETGPIGAFDQGAPPRMRMDQRNETFVPHLLAVPAGTVVDFPDLEGEALRPRALRQRPLQVGAL